MTAICLGVRCASKHRYRYTCDTLDEPGGFLFLLRLEFGVGAVNRVRTTIIAHKIGSNRLMRLLLRARTFIIVKQLSASPLFVAKDVGIVRWIT